VGFTSGVFDLVHPGHVAYLENARLECDILVVGVNSDRSVRENKGELRPICGEAERSAVIAGLGSVDYVFVFDERNNNKNIEILRPDVYLKAGDYDRSKLSSAGIVEAYGGRVVFVPFADGHGTTGIIDRIAGRYGAVCEPTPLGQLRPAVFLDRDGTLNEHVEYIHEVEKFRLIPGVLAALKRLKDHGFRLIVVTNQPGIGMGYFTKEDFFRVNRELLKAVRAEGVTLDRVYFCPHSDNDRCACRKPGTLLVERAVRELNIDLTRSFVVGDTTGDVELARRAGCRSILVRTGLGGADGHFAAVADHVAENLTGAAEHIVQLVGQLEMPSSFGQ
jgi:rfaE bifunctional protein nucleotidyltransferase chain/domain